MRKPTSLSHKKFLIHLIRNTLLSILLIFLALFIGMSGYHYFESMPWIDAFLNASMILSGMGPVQTLTTHGGKLFAGFYALFSGLTFIVLIGVLLSPLLQLIIRKIHWEFKN